MDRFELEQAIMGCWATGDDLDLLVTSVLEPGDEGLDPDALANALIGVQALHNLRMQHLFNVFESLVTTGQFIANPTTETNLLQKKTTKAKGK